MPGANNVKKSLGAFYGSVCGPDLRVEDNMIETLWLHSVAVFILLASLSAGHCSQPALVTDPDACANGELVSCCSTLSESLRV